jgi:predicted small lipoprotein YifL
MKSLINSLIVLLFAALSLSFSSCGKKGDLFLEGEQKEEIDNEQL